MFTVGIDVKKTKRELIIKWQMAKFNILLEDIIKISEDDTYGGAKTDAIRIGPSYGTTDRIYIKTKKQDYLIFTTNKFPIMKEINS
ncbi:SunI/YnzG family protein [Priestia filamentosa]